MQVTIGWATEFARQRFAVTAEEVDVRRILDANGLDGVTNVLLTASEVFKLLDTEARIFAEAEKLHMLATGSPDRAPVIATVRELQELQKRNLGKIRERLSE